MIKISNLLSFKNIILVFIVEGTKQSQVEAKLLKDGKALPLKDVEIVVGEDKITFKIKKPSHDQSGIYQVKISNNQGEEVKDVNINMQGKLILIYNNFYSNSCTVIQTCSACFSSDLYKKNLFLRRFTMFISHKNLKINVTLSFVFNFLMLIVQFNLVLYFLKR